MSKQLSPLGGIWLSSNQLAGSKTGEGLSVTSTGMTLAPRRDQCGLYLSLISAIYLRWSAAVFCAWLTFFDTRLGLTELRDFLVCKQECNLLSWLNFVTRQGQKLSVFFFFIVPGILKVLPLYFIWALCVCMHQTPCILWLSGESGDSCIKSKKFGGHVEVCVLAIFEVFLWISCLPLGWLATM